MIKKWKTIGSKTVYKGEKFSVKKNTLQLPTKKQKDYEFLDLGNFASVVALRDGKILMINQYRAPVDKITLEIPAGNADGQPPEKAAARELEEETGFKAKKLTKLMTFHPIIGRSKSTMNVFFASDLQQTEQRLDEDEFVEVVWVPVDEVVKKILAGEVTHASTVVGVLAARARGLL